MTNSRFSFLRRVRIHGGECGAVARALHHAVKGLSLYQADPGKASGSTDERKSMSTKTMFKRIALATVSALGIGLLSSVPVNAANTSTASFTKSFSVSSKFLTVVGAADTSTAGIFWVDVTNESAAAGTSSMTNDGLVPSFETLTVSVLEAPSTARAITDVNLRMVKIAKASGSSSSSGDLLRIIPNSVDSWTGRTNATSVAFDSSTVAGVNATNSISRNESSDFTPAVGSTTGQLRRYPVAVAAKVSGALGAGYYTLQLRIQTADARVLTDTIKVRFVSTIADADAKVTVAAKGTFGSGDTLTFQTERSVSATLAGATNSDRIFIGRAVATADSAAAGTSDVVVDSPTVASLAPAMTATLVTSAGVVIADSDLTVADNGTAAVDHVAPITKGSATDTAENAAMTALRTISDGTYGVYNASGVGDGRLPTSLTNSATNQIRVRLTDSSVEGLATITTVETRTALTSASVKIAGTGVAAVDTALTSAITASTSDATTNVKAYSLPLSNKSVTLTIDSNGGAGTNLTTKISWSGNYASANVTPATDTSLTTATNADGEITRTITNSSPLAGAVATVLITGFTNPDHSVSVTLTWAAAKVDKIEIVEPVSGIHTALKGTTRFVVSVKDQFGNLMVGEQLQPSITGTTSANYSATTTYSPITTGADGTATWTLTDALAVADKTDSVRFASISNASATPATYTITYKTTVAAVGSFLKFYANDWNTASASVTTSVPTTGIYSDTNTASLKLIGKLNLSDGKLASYADDQDDAAVVFRFRALTAAGVAATGAAVTVTASSGGHIVGASGLPVTSRTFAVGTTGDVTFQALATAPGAITITATSGATSDSAAFWVANPTGTAARTIAITGATTGTANGEGVPMTVTVKDRYGNPVDSVNLTLSASGVGSFAGGATTQSFTTDSKGTYTFLATSLVSAGGTGTFTASIATTGTDADSVAGYFLGGNEVDSTLAAGVKSASASITFAAGQNKAEAAAEAASDAALEAIDAANAATDAANLAAEAADAATVAAEEARDAADAATAAVEALASEVATLIAGLKAQITTLANTVAKIAKRVRA